MRLIRGYRHKAGDSPEWERIHHWAKTTKCSMLLLDVYAPSYLFVPTFPYVLPLSVWR